MNLIHPVIYDKKFQYAVTVVLHHEGGYVDDKKDRGGVTNFGISLRYLRDIKIDVNGDGAIDGKDIRLMDKGEATEIYKKYWWDKYHYNNIVDTILATKVLDLSVNVGEIEAHKIVQRALNTNGTTVSIDGILGKHSFDAINSQSNDTLLKCIRAQSVLFYLNLIKIHPQYIKYRDGWLRRADD